MRNWAHPIAVRERAVAAMDDGEMTVEQVARVFRVGVRTLYDWKELLRERGSLSPRAHRSGNKARVDERGAVVVREILAQEPDSTIEETAIYFVERTNTPCSRSAMGRALQRMGLTRKKRR